jgi:hypothetical protein
MMLQRDDPSSCRSDVWFGSIRPSTANRDGVMEGFPVARRLKQVILACALPFRTKKIRVILALDAR